MEERSFEVIKKSEEVVNVQRIEDNKMISCQPFLIIGNSLEKYVVTKEKRLNELDGNGSSLNNYLYSITHSLLYFEGASRKGEEIVYYTDTKGISKELELTGIQEMMRKKAPAVVTPEGIILMYLPEQIVATIDCFTEKFILVKNIDSEVKAIENIEVDCVSLKTYVNCVLNDDSKIKKEIYFTFDFTAATAPSSVLRVYFK